MPTPLLSDPAATTAFAHAAVPALARFGVAVIDISPGYVRLRMPLEGNANHVGTMYAGSLFAIAELPGGVLPWSVLSAGAVVPIVKKVCLEYRRPAVTDVEVQARMDPGQIRLLAEQAAEHGKADFDLELSVCDASGAVVMTAATTTQLRRIQSPA